MWASAWFQCTAIALYALSSYIFFSFLIGVELRHFSVQNAYRGPGPGITIPP